MKRIYFLLIAQLCFLAAMASGTDDENSWTDWKPLNSAGTATYIYKVYWNDSIIIAKNDSMNYEIIKLIPEPAEGVPWIETGYMSSEEFMEYSIDTASMRQIDLSKHPHWRDMKNRE